MVGAIYDSLSIRRPPRATVIAELVRQLLQASSVDVDHIDVEVAALERGEHELSPIRRQNTLCRVDAEARQAPKAGPVRVRRVHVVRIQTPDIAFGRIRP